MNRIRPFQLFFSFVAMTAACCLSTAQEAEPKKLPPASSSTEQSKGEQETKTPSISPTPDSPDDSEAVKLLQSGKVAEAFEELRRIAKETPNYPPARVRLSELLMQMGQNQPARMQLEQAVKENPKHPAGYLLNGYVAVSENRITDAILSLRTSLELSEDSRWNEDLQKLYRKQARMGLASAYEARGEWETVKEHLAVVLKDEPKFTPARVRNAYANFWLEKPDHAYIQLQEVFKDNDKIELPELQMASLWGQLGDKTESEEWLKKAVEKHSEDARSHRAYASWLLDNNRPKAAEPYIEAAYKIAPGERDTLALRGMLYRHSREFDKAIKDFEDLKKRYPDDSFIAWNLALSQAESEDEQVRRQAVALAEAEVRKAPRTPEAYSVLGWCYFQAGRLEDAEQALNAAVSTGQIPSDTAYYLAKLLFERERYKDAQTLLREAINGTWAFPNKSVAIDLLQDVEKKLKEAAAKEKKEEPKK